MSQTIICIIVASVLLAFLIRSEADRVISELRSPQQKAEDYELARVAEELREEKREARLNETGWPRFKRDFKVTAVVVAAAGLLGAAVSFFR
jgi:hypothetical protein